VLEMEDGVIFNDRRAPHDDSALREESTS